MAKPRKSPTAEPGNRIAFLRLQRGLSQEEMATLTGIPLRTYLRIEREEGKKANPGVRHLANIARVLGFDPEKGGLAEVSQMDWLEWQVFHENGPKEQPHVTFDPDRFVDPATY